MDLIHDAQIIRAGSIDAENVAIAGDFINTGLCDDTFIVIQTDDMASQSAAVTLDQGATATGGTDTVAFAWMWTNSGDVTSDALVRTAVTSNTFDIDTDNAMYIIKVPSNTLAADTPYLQVDVAAPGGTATVTAAYICTGLRYHEANPPSMVT